MSDQKINVLCLPSWYPDNIDPTNGIFIQKHIESILPFCNVTVLYVAADPTLSKSTYAVKEQAKEDHTCIYALYKVKDTTTGFSSRLTRLNRYSKAVWKGMQRVAKYRQKYDLIHVHVAHPAGRIAWLLNYINKTPYLLTEHWTGYTPFNRSFEKWFWLNKWMTRKVYQNAQFTTTVSDFLKTSLLTQNLNAQPITTIPNVVETFESFEPINKKNAPLKALTISDLRDDQKNISGLLYAVQRLIQQYPDFELHHIGVGPDEQKLKQLARQLNLLGKNVFFHGYIPHKKLKGHFQNAHFFVLNSRYETFSVVTAEALAHGLPVVITRCGAPEEYVDSKVGYLVHRDDQHSLSEGLSFMCSNWQLYDQNELRQRVKQKFSKERVGKQFYHVYQKVLGDA